MFQFDVGENGEKADEIVGRLRWLAGMGIENVMGGVRDVWRLKPLEIMAERVIPAVADLEPQKTRATA
jgi:hypothetical protein